MDAERSTYEIEREGDTVVITPLMNISDGWDDLDYQHLEGELRRLLESSTPSHAHNIVIDFHNTMCSGSAAANLFVELWKTTKSHSGRIALCGLSPTEVETFHMTRHDSRWPIFSTRAEAIEMVESGVCVGQVVEGPGLDAIQEASEESFPASDAPAWTHLSVGGNVMNCLLDGFLGPAPKSAADYGTRGITFLTQGDCERAIGDCTKAIRLDPQLSAAYLIRGIALEEKGEFNRAEADFSEAIRLDPGDAIAYIDRGSAFDEHGDTHRAIADYTEAIRLNPNLVEAWLCRGIEYYEIGEYERAIADLTEAIRLDPVDPDAYRGRSMSYRKMGDELNAACDDSKANELSCTSATKREPGSLI